MKKRGNRPWVGQDKVRRYSISLPPEIAESLRQMGGGNMSRGIRLGHKSLAVALEKGSALAIHAERLIVVGAQ